VFAAFFMTAAVLRAEDAPVTARLVSRDLSIAPGSDVVLAVEMVHAPGWHTYGKNSVTGMPTEIKVVAPADLEPEVNWPVPVVREEGGAVDRLYEGEMAIPIRFAAPKDLKVGQSLHVAVDVSWVACKEMCVPGYAKLSIDLPVENAARTNLQWAARISEAAPRRSDGMALAFESLFGLLGGLILNLMPCVFPVIGLKVFSLAKQAGQNRRDSWIGALAFLAGVLATLWTLTAVLVAARNAGSALGWGFQLQNPWVVFAGVLLFFILGLNLLGVFEIGMGAGSVGASLEGRSGAIGAFLSGVLAVVVATPCSAPLLGTAMGYALVGTALEAFVVFGAIGVGFALPYLLFAAFPALLRALPKPGIWMVRLKKILSLFMFLTAAYLVWILAALADSRFFGPRIAGALFITLAAAIVYGKMYLPHRSRLARIAGIVIAAKLLIVAAVVGWPTASKGKTAVANDVIAPAFVGDSSTPHLIAWKKGLPEKLAAEGHVVWVDFTARWCATCQMNKTVVFSSKEVREYFRDHGIYIVEADWTARDDAIARELAGHGRQAVPLNLIYAPDRREPYELPTILTQGIVLENLRKAGN
jgi:thiol:disulfide interchange protein DsbD